MAQPTESASQLSPALVQALAERFLAAFPEKVDGTRTVGRELEFPMVAADGSAADVRRLWELLLAHGDLKSKHDVSGLLVEAAGADFSYTIEVGVGTIELNTRPCRSLLEVQALAEKGVQRLVRVAAAYGWRVLGYGIQPVTAPALSLMTPKQRYQSLYRAMGSQWLWYTVTAADQLHWAICRDEVIPVLNFGNLMAPVIIALCANSPVHAATLSPYCSAREAQHVLIHASEFRHGMPLRPFADAEDFVRRLAQATHLIARSDGRAIPQARPFSATLAELEGDVDAAYAAFLFHEHYVWNSARARAAYGTIELRPACQQPWGEHMAAAALGVGLLEAREAIEAYIGESVGLRTSPYREAGWETMRVWHKQVIRNGLEAPQPAPGFLTQILALAEEGLRRRGLNEEVLLAPAWNRLERLENPAQRARRLYRSDGLNALIASATIRPGGRG
ncbi:MAG: glutamate-cysteine ligase family protein [Caldilineaceae bacterium]